MSLAASACTLTPRNGEWISDLTQTYSGYHRVPNERLSIQFYNMATLKWQTVVTLRSAATAIHTDPCGNAWYPWHAEITLPNPVSNNPFWHTGFVHSIRSRVVAASGDILRSFSESGDQCIEQYECGHEILHHCGNSTGEIVLFCDGCTS